MPYLSALDVRSRQGANPRLPLPSVTAFFIDEPSILSDGKLATANNYSLYEVYARSS